MKVRTIVAADGASQQIGFFDSEFDVACEFRRATDGMTRCLPGMPLPTVFTSAFLDDQCTTPGTFLNYDCSGFWINTEGATACPIEAEWTVRRSVGAKATPYQLSGPTCTPVPGFNGYRVEVVDPSEFVSGTESVQ